jgi:hypothetical protein
VFAWAKPTDMRKSFRALAAVVTGELQSDPLSGSVYLFVARNKQRAKITWVDRIGFCLFQKQFPRGSFAGPSRGAGPGAIVAAALVSRGVPGTKETISGGLCTQRFPTALARRTDEVYGMVRGSIDIRLVKASNLFVVVQSRASSLRDCCAWSPHPRTPQRNELLEFFRLEHWNIHRATPAPKNFHAVLTEDGQPRIPRAFLGRDSRLKTCRRTRPSVESEPSALRAPVGFGGV